MNSEVDSGRARSDHVRDAYRRYSRCTTSIGKGSLQPARTIQGARDGPIVTWLTNKIPTMLCAGKTLGVTANNRAWALAEALHRSPEEDEEMLQAAHAAMYFWKIVGTPRNHAHAAQLLAHVYALLRLPGPAAQYLSRSLPYFMQNDPASWELAFAHAIAANVAFAEGNEEAHAKYYSEAKTLTSQVTNPDEREMIDATLRVIPAPRR